MAEEAAFVAQEFVSSLDNLPAEVAHILGEIRTKEDRCQELQIRLSNRTGSILKHVRGLEPGKLNLMPNPKEQTNQQKIAKDFKEIQELQKAKTALSIRLSALLHKTCGRLEGEMQKVAELGGVELPRFPPLTEIAKNGYQLPHAGTGLQALGSGGMGIKVLDQMRDNSFASPVSNHGGHGASSASISGGSSNKKRKISTATPTAAAYKPHASSRLKHSSSHHGNRRASPTDSEDAEGDEEEEYDLMDAEGEDDEEAVGDDETLYCYCRQKSHGEMVGCDNATCPIEWFHVKCVDAPSPLPDTWYCPTCISTVGAASNKKSGGGRKR